MATAVRSLRYIKDVEKSGARDMRKVNQHSQAIHFFYD
jgi:hypothetical protein